MERKIALITGGAGFIGSHTADALAARGHKIRILDNLEPAVHKGGRWPKYVSGRGYELMRGDVRKKKDWERALRGASRIFHFAAYQDQRPDFGKFFEVNAAGTALLYETIAAKKLPVEKIVIASSQFVYGDGAYRCAHGGKKQEAEDKKRGMGDKCFYPELRSERQFKSKKFDILCSHGKPAEFLPFCENQPLNPTNAYGLSKEAMERLALRFGNTYGIPTAVLRYSVVQGPRQSPHNLYSGALRIFAMQALRGEPITVFEDGRQLRDFVNIEDVVAANIIAARSRKTDFQIYNVGGGRGYEVLDFAKLVKKISGSASPIEIGGFRRTDTRHAVSDITKLEKLGWRPRFGPEKSIRDYLAWLKKNS